MPGPIPEVPRRRADLEDPRGSMFTSRFLSLSFFAPFDVFFHFLFTFTSLHFPPLPSNSTSLAPPRLWLSMHRPRTQFYALPKSDRLRRLTLHCYEQYIKSGLDEDEFRMQYKFMGYTVCRRAFVKLTAVDVGTIVQCRKDALATPPRLRPFEKGELPGHIIEGKETDRKTCHLYVPKSWPVLCQLLRCLIYCATT